MNIRRSIFVLGACIAAGCSLLEPRPDNSRFFILTPISHEVTTAAPAVPAGRQISVGVGPIEFPVYLRRPQMVTRSAPNKIELSEEKRWAEPLDKNFMRVLCGNLTELVNAGRIEKYPWPKKNPVDYQVTVDLERFEISTDGRAYLIARWTIKNGQSSKDLYQSVTTATESVGEGESGPSAALSKDLAVLSADIAAGLLRISSS